MELREWASELQLGVDEFILDGKVHRYGKKNSGWYVGWETPVKVVVAGDWATGKRYEYKCTARKTTREENKFIKDKQALAIRAAVEEREQRKREALEKSRHELSIASKIGSHEYLTKKQVGNYGVYFKDGELLIPTCDIDGNVHGMQRITKSGLKLFQKDQAIKGMMHKIEGNDSVIYIVEGYATGASVHMATGNTVFCAFNAGNLKDVARDVRRKNPDTPIVIAGDDDTKTVGNPGRTKADEAAHASGSASLFPKFPDGTEGSDWNDLHVGCGIEEVKKQLSASDGSEIVFRALGRKGDTYYFYSYMERSLRRFNSFYNVQFYGLAPRDYWESMFPNPRGKDSPIDWDGAKSKLIEQCKKETFDETRIRGCGVWSDKGRIVLNTGRKIICEGMSIPASRFSSDYVYIDSSRQIRYEHDNMLSSEDGRIIAEACSRFRWADKRSGIYLAGWLAIARIAGFLPIRPHVWLTGGAGTGKSTLLEGLIQVILGSRRERLYLNNGTTEAGIRQQLSSDAVPVIFDEFETLNEGSKNRIESIMDLLRQSWSQGHSSIIKGSADGNVSIYQVAFCALVSSIRINLTNDADRTRFTILELDKHDSDSERWNSIKACLALITDEMSVRLMSRAINMAPVVIENFKRFKKVLAAKAMGQRYADQHGMLLAGYAMLTQDCVISELEAEALVDSMGGEHDLEEDRRDQIADHDECLNWLLSYKIRVDKLPEQWSAEEPTRKVFGGTEMEIGEVIRQDDQDRLDSLKSYGILVERDFVFIPVSHHGLKSIYRGTRWEHGWAKSLSRITGSEKSVVKWFGGKAIRTVTN
jgi:putative DNA primase/helicase